MIEAHLNTIKLREYLRNPLRLNQFMRNKKIKEHKQRNNKKGIKVVKEKDELKIGRAMNYAIQLPTTKHGLVEITFIKQNK